MTDNDIVDSLKQISKNLDDISKVIEGTKKIEEHKPKTKEIDILYLVKLIDNHYCILFKWYDVFLGGLGFMFGALILIAVAILISITNDAVILHSFGDNGLALVLSGLAVIFAFYSFIAQVGEGNEVDIRYKRALGIRQSKKDRPMDEDEKPILKALIKIRSKNTKFPLEQIINMHPTMFNKDKLTEKLYDS
jgi:hypothetical protein